MPTTEEGRRAWILYKLRLAGYDLARLAREIGVERSTPMRAFYRRYPRMEQAIAGKIGVAAQDIWPERYDESGAPISRRKNQKSHRHTFAQCQRADNAQIRGGR